MQYRSTSLAFLLPFFHLWCNVNGTTSYGETKVISGGSIQNSPFWNDQSNYSKSSLRSGRRLVAAAMEAPIGAESVAAAVEEQPEPDVGSVTTAMIKRLFLLTVQGRPSKLFDNDFQTIEQFIVNCYNELASGVCPPPSTFIPMGSVTFDLDNNIESYGSEPRIITGTIDFTLILEATVECGNGCNPDIFTLFRPVDQVGDQRMLLDGEVIFPVDSQACAPTEMDFKEYLSVALASYNSATDLLGGLDQVTDVTELEYYSDETFATCSDADLRDLFSSSSTIAVEGDWSKATPAQIKELETIIVDVYNGLNALNPDLCDGESRVVTSAAIEIYNEQGIQFNPSTGRLLLQEGNEKDDEGNDLDSPHRQRRSLNSKWWYLKIGRGGTCYGCPKDSCIANDVSGYTKTICKSTEPKDAPKIIPKEDNNGGRRALTTAVAAIDYSASCYCAPDAPRTLPTTTDFMNELNEAIQLLRSDPSFGFDFVSSVVYATEADTIPNSCCGFPTDENIPVPSNVDFQEAIDQYMADPFSSPYGYPLNCWDTSRVTDMSFAFSNYEDFNEELYCWDTSNVEDMKGMFFKASQFDQELESWDVATVKYMDSMFFDAVNFNKPLGSWSITGLESATHMFDNAASFRRNLCGWRNRDENLIGVTKMFQGSSCRVTDDPVVGGNGPYCKNCPE